MERRRRTRDLRRRGAAAGRDPAGRRSAALPLVLVAGALSLLGPSAATAQDADRARPVEVERSEGKLYFGACPAYAADYTFDCYHDYAEVTEFLEAAEAAHPRRATLRSIGESWEGRDIWVLTITDPSTGEPGTKPAVWVDGGIDADEVVSVEAALGLVHRLLESGDERVGRLLATRTFYVAPVLMPDANELHHHTPIRPRDTSLRPLDEDGDGVADEDPPEDLDGDGEALLMAKRDTLGDMVRDEDDPRIFRERRAGDEGPFFDLYIEGVDNDGDGAFQEDRLGGVDPNRNYPGNWDIRQGGSGPYPASEAGIRAAFEFVADHPEIAASQHFHSSGGVVLRPPSVPGLELPEDDRDLYMDLSRLGLEVTGYDLATSVYDWNWPPGSKSRGSGQVWRDAEGDLHGYPVGESYGPYASGGRRGALPGGPGGGAGLGAYPAYGGSIDGMYLTFGVLAFANEIYPMGQDYDGDGEVEEAEQLRYDDEEMDGYAFREFSPHDHPQLGEVLIGGWRKFGQNNPPPDELDAEVERNVDFVLMQAAHTPLLQVGPVEVEDLSGGVYRVTAEARNAGHQPTELSIRREQGRAEPVRMRLEGAEVLGGEAERELGVLAGHSREEAVWVVRGDPGDRLSVRLSHPKGGTAGARVRLPSSPGG